MQFLYQPLTWAFLLVAAPLLIHLINLMRHKRVRWAAMDFLLASYKKHRRWIWLKQLLLLLLRMLAIAAAVAMLAALVTNRQYAGVWSAQTPHHVILLDDTLSMASQSGGADAFDRARNAISQIVRFASEEPIEQRLSLIRYTRATRTSDVQTSEEVATDLYSISITAAFEEILHEQQRQIDVTELAGGPRDALVTAQQILQDDPHRKVVHVVSDFRRSDWSAPQEIKKELIELERLGAEIHFVRSVQQSAENLAVTRLEPQEGTHAAGVPLMVEATVRNYGSQPVEQTKLQARSIYYATLADGTPQSPVIEQLPDVIIDDIPPGESVSKAFQVFFPGPGQHVVEITTPADALEQDNTRRCVVDLPESELALIVDGDTEQRSAYYLESIFRPGLKTKTGIQPDTRPMAFLRDASAEQLGEYHVIYLANVASLDDRSRENLRQYVENGGGLAVFAGPSANPALHNRWHQQQGLFPVPIDGIQELDREVAVRGVTFQPHPIAGSLAEAENPFARSIRIDTLLRVPATWSPDPESGTSIIATVANGIPLLVENTYGKGKVVACLTSVAPQWNNWALEPSMIVVVLQMHAHLAQQQRFQPQRVVGTPLTVQLDGQRYRPDLVFSAPSKGQTGRRIERTAKPIPDTQMPLLLTQLGTDPSGLMATGETDQAGVYEATLTLLDGKLEHRRFAYNVPNTESDLAIIDSAMLVQSLEPVSIRLDEYDDLTAAGEDPSLQSWSQILLWSLLGLLLIEQVVAYSASYHPSRPAVEV